MTGILSLEDVIRELSVRKEKIALVTGNFNILHPGHFRLLKFAKDCADKLVVAVNADSKINQPDYMEENYRAEVICSLELVDYCLILESSTIALIDLIKPEMVAKGFEYMDQDNPEQEILESYGGKLVFCPGDFSTSIPHRHQAFNQPILNANQLNGYMSRHDVTVDNLQSFIREFSELKLLVIGDIIVDQYIQCNAVGMSQEDPTIVVTPDSKNLFLGGAGITAAHAKGLGAKQVSLFSIAGEDEYYDYVVKRLNDYGVQYNLHQDDSRPTNLKTRYRVGNKTMLRVNEVRNHEITKELQRKIWQQLEPCIDGADAVVFSDFNYGMLPQGLVDKITRYCRKANKVMVADSQSSSQIGDISRFKHMDLVTPTEREARLAVNNNRDGLVLLAEKLRIKSSCKNIVITLGEDGAFLHMPKEAAESAQKWQNDKIAALASEVNDPAGAGDCYLAAATLALCSGADFWHASLVGSVAAACQVSRLGNKPLQHGELLEALECLK